jgi:hypothetical protein
MIRGVRHPRKATSTPGVRFALTAVALALFGLLSMHGWGSHAGMHPPQGTASAADVMMAQAGHHDALGMVADAAAALDQVPGAPVVGDASQDPGENGGAGLLGLCLAVLASALLLGIALLIARGGVATGRGLLRAWRPILPIGRDRDPPDLRKLCVIRS